MKSFFLTGLLLLSGCAQQYVIDTAEAERAADTVATAEEVVVFAYRPNGELVGLRLLAGDEVRIIPRGVRLEDLDPLPDAQPLVGLPDLRPDQAALFEDQRHGQWLIGLGAVGTCAGYFIALIAAGAGDDATYLIPGYGPVAAMVDYFDCEDDGGCVLRAVGSVFVVPVLVGAAIWQVLGPALMIGGFTVKENREVDVARVSLLPSIGSEEAGLMLTVPF